MTADSPREADLELVASLSGDDVASIDEALIAQLRPQLVAAKDVVARAHQSLRATQPGVPDVFFSYRLRKLVALGRVVSQGPVGRDLRYSVGLPGFLPPVA